ncbi:MarR family transcriptional regulator, partial [Candidatus Woesearchaeota archaeon CG11_big_fil_rev_8_21_14_0_20_57_5]
MIDFACKHFELDEIIRCGFGLTKGELRLLYSLESTEWQSAEDLAGTLGLSTSSMQRSLKRLTEKGIVARRQMNLSSGGYQFE